MVRRRQITGTLAAPRTLLLARYDVDGNLAYVGRTTNLTAAASSTVAPLLSPAADDHPWTGWTFSVGWGSRETLDVMLVEADLVGEVGVDVARRPSSAAWAWRWR
ncbi:hypothetical protein [Streptomyces sp. 039-1]|uniref:hypothetical protein n=1 Tax=Streptomyces sp. 039-1 TaxID=2789263 RepID=UPI0039F4F370